MASGSPLDSCPLTSVLPCPRYRDYRSAQDYNLSGQFWVLLAVRLAFLILFEVGQNWGRGFGVGAAPSSPPPWPPSPHQPASASTLSPCPPPLPTARSLVHQAHRCLVCA